MDVPSLDTGGPARRSRLTTLIREAVLQIVPPALLVGLTALQLSEKTGIDLSITLTLTTCALAALLALAASQE